jgi:hypothetical protein
MPNALYDTAREGFLTGQVDYDTATIKAVLVRGGAFVTTQQFMSELVAAGATLHGTPMTLTGKTTGGAVADAADGVFATPPANPTGHVIVVYQSSAVTGGADVAATAQRLIAWLDSYTGLPVTPNGADISVAWPNDTNRIFRL